ncbi:hypothetical protein AAG570_003176 [Ranatra chinensis]|uniref:non-specific serine/threonine protein kinase n=1 Tax=Ranatra chinensis TaxID=642074 RepID=A0ABD0Y630_9HEMI
MEFCEEGSLADRLLKNAIEDADMAKSIFKQILNGIDYIHKQNMIHRDIKPQNIFFSTQDKIKIGDFGLVTDIGTDISCKGEELKKRSACGTRLYLSPEQVGSELTSFFSN